MSVHPRFASDGMFKSGGGWVWSNTIAKQMVVVVVGMVVVGVVVVGMVVVGVVVGLWLWFNEKTNEGRPGSSLWFSMEMVLFGKEVK